MSTELDPQFLIDRREAIKRVSALLGGAALVGSSALWTGCAREPVPGEGNASDPFTDTDVAFLDEVAETILPETKTPGAKAAKVGAFMALMVTDTYEPKDQLIFRKGMQQLDEASRKAHNTSFMSATPDQRLALLRELDREAKEYMDHKDDEPEIADEAVTTERRGKLEEGNPTHYFRMMKELALLGYFTSEIGYTQAMRYVESPGKFEPCVPYTKGEVAWAPHA
ncbi:MAG: gluconate 2-dehydrogenase subunit 3 family protein [Gemmatimonadaceae bacterium]